MDVWPRSPANDPTYVASLRRDLHAIGELDHEWISLRTLSDRDDPQLCALCGAQRTVIAEESVLP
jgi:hypothetical protein